MKNILFITPKNPFSSISGGTIVTKNAIEILSEIYELDLLFLDNEDTKYFDYKNIKNIIKVPHILKPKNIKTIIKSIFSELPLSIYRNDSELAQEKLSQIANNYDIIYVDHWLMMQFIPRDYKGTVLLREHNAEYKMWERYLKKEKNLLVKLFLIFEISKIKKYEKYICNSANNVLTLSEKDKENLIKIGVNKDKISMLPAITIDNKIVKKHTFAEKENTILYIGTFNWEANVDGLDYFLKNIYPYIRKEFKNIKFYIVGKNPPKKLIEYSKKDPTIIFTGFVEDLTDYYYKAKLFITYLRFGSGIKIKILEALAQGLPVVSNDIGLEGINTDAAMLCKNNQEFVNNIVSLLKDNNKLQQMSEVAFDYIKQNYSKNNFIESFNQIISGENYDK